MPYERVDLPVNLLGLGHNVAGDIFFDWLVKAHPELNPVKTAKPPGAGTNHLWDYWVKLQYPGHTKKATVGITQHSVNGRMDRPHAYVNAADALVPLAMKVLREAMESLAFHNVTAAAAQQPPLSTAPPSPDPERVQDSVPGVEYIDPTSGHKWVWYSDDNWEWVYPQEPAEEEFEV